MVLQAKQKIINEERIRQVKDDQKNAVLVGYYSALFERQKKIHFPTSLIEEIYKQDEDEEPVTMEELKDKTAILKAIKNRRLSNGK